MMRTKHPLSLVASAFAVLMLFCTSMRAQDPGGNDFTNAVLEAAAAVVSNAIAQLGDMAVTNEVSESNDLSQAEQSSESATALNDTNLQSTGPGRSLVGPSESRRQWILRQRAGTAGSNEPGSTAKSSETNAAVLADFRVVKPDYSTFKLILERNVFDPNRAPRRQGNQPKPRTLDSLTLVGIMSYDKGTFAFFDGSSSEYKKAVKLADTIAGHKLTSIEPNSVKLSAGTNQVELRVGMQLHREEGGDWTVSAQHEIYAANSTPTATARASAAPSGSENDVLERLRKKREQE